MKTTEGFFRSKKKLALVSIVSVILVFVLYCFAGLESITKLFLREESVDYSHVELNPPVFDMEEKAIKLPSGVYQSKAKRCDDLFKGDKYGKVISLSKSQSKEDQFLLKFAFHSLCGGSYVELGALNGVAYSNSFLFNFALGWRGLLIEPNPFNFRGLVENRPTDKLFNNAACSSESIVHWATVVKGDVSAISGIWEFMPQAFRDFWVKEIDVNNLQEISCKPLSGIIDDSPLSNQHVDFLSIDVEGAEFEVVKTLDFSKHQFGMIFYEADDFSPVKNEAVKTYLERNGYTFRLHTLRSNFHINKNWDEIYAHLL